MHPEPVTGQVLGMDDENVLEITDLYPFASLLDEASQEEYQFEMMKSLRDSNVDHSTVGWYHSTAVGGCISQSFFEIQQTYQLTIPSSVVLVYDHLLSTQGAPAVEALRLKNEFVHDKRRFNELEGAPIDCFERIPIEIVISPLEQVFLIQMSSESSIPSVPIFPPKKPMLESITSNFIEAMDDNLSESGRYQHYLRNMMKQHQILLSLKQKKKNGEEVPEDEQQPLTHVKTVSEPSKAGLFYSMGQLEDIIAALDQVSQNSTMTFDCQTKILK